MMTVTPHSTFFAQLHLYSQRQFTGKLEVTVASEQQWCLYLSLGHLVWASGGVHPTRRLRRQLAGCIPQINLKEIALRESDRFECWDYHTLTLLVQRHVARTEEIVALMRGLLAEALFDILQALEIASATQQMARVNESSDELMEQQPLEPELFSIQPRLGVRPSSNDTGILPRTWTWEIEAALSATQKTWEQWSQMGLALYSPNLAPTISSLEKLQANTPTSLYTNLVALINGKRTLRDLAVLLKKDMVGLTRSLVPYVRQRLMGLVEVPDLPNAALTSPQKSSASTPRRRQQPTQKRKRLIACIDDNPRIGVTMKKLLTNAGYECVVIQDAVQSIPTLLQHKPDTIFLDLVMPIANGYEICSQIRRISKFEDTPVIILTGRDGIVDRVRAKMVGATDFLCKPIEPRQVLAALRKYQESDIAK